MTLFFYVQEEKIVGKGSCRNLSLKNIPVTETIYNDYEENKYIFQDDEIILNPNYQQEQAQKERERLDMLSLTKADVLLALYEDKGITPENIKTMLADNVPALIKFDYASSYYRGDEVVNALGLALGYTTEDMDYLFENKTFPTVEETEEETPEEETDSGEDVEISE